MVSPGTPPLCRFPKGLHPLGLHGLAEPRQAVPVVYQPLISSFIVSSSKIRSAGAAAGTPRYLPLRPETRLFVPGGKMFSARVRAAGMKTEPGEARRHHNAPFLGKPVSATGFPFLPSNSPRTFKSRPRPPLPGPLAPAVSPVTASILIFFRPLPAIIRRSCTRPPRAGSGQRDKGGLKRESCGRHKPSAASAIRPG